MSLCFCSSHRLGVPLMREAVEVLKPPRDKKEASTLTPCMHQIADAYGGAMCRGAVVVVGHSGSK